MSEPGLIYSKIPEVMRAVGAVGKNKKNQGQGFMFRGIDDMYNALHDPMCHAEIFATPEVLEIQREDRTSGKGGALIYTTLKVRHRFYASDGSFVDVTTVGEAMDSGDKSANKAMSAAYKYALMELFCIPTEETFDTEYESHDVAPTQARAAKPSSNGNGRPVQPQNGNNGHSKAYQSPMQLLMARLEKERVLGKGGEVLTAPHIQNILKAENFSAAVTAENAAAAFDIVKQHCGIAQPVNGDHRKEYARQLAADYDDESQDALTDVKNTQ